MNLSWRRNAASSSIHSTGTWTKPAWYYQVDSISLILQDSSLLLHGGPPLEVMRSSLAQCFRKGYLSYLIIGYDPSAADILRCSWSPTDRQLIVNGSLPCGCIKRAWNGAKRIQPSNWRMSPNILKQFQSKISCFRYFETNFLLSQNNDSIIDSSLTGEHCRRFGQCRPLR